MAWRLGNGKLRKDQTDHYGRLKNGGGGGGATVDDFTDTDTIIFSKDVETQKVRADIAVDVANKIENSLQTPLSTPTATELVGVGTDKSQQRINIGEGIIINNNLMLNVIKLQFEFFEKLDDFWLYTASLTEDEYNKLNDYNSIVFLDALFLPATEEEIYYYGSHVLFMDSSITTEVTPRIRYFYYSSGSSIWSTIEVAEAEGEYTVLAGRVDITETTLKTNIIDKVRSIVLNRKEA